MYDGPSEIELTEDILTFRRCREELGWSHASLARQLDCSRVTIFYWESGRTSIPPRVLEWIVSLAAIHRTLPPPADWRRNPGYPYDASRKGSTPEDGSG
ncbi:MAG: helix-turn-helix domain-containing protein [Candidatus Dormibacteria bacterium]